MILSSGDMKLLPPDMKSRNNFMTGKREFHVAEKVDFPDAEWMAEDAWMEGIYEFPAQNSQIQKASFILVCFVQ